jgi:hypothetical protein
MWKEVAVTRFNPVVYYDDYGASVSAGDDNHVNGCQMFE